MSYIAWKEINWPQVDSRILRYQTRIFKASRDNNIPKVRCLQKRLLQSLDAKLVAVRQVTTLNKVNKTVGVENPVFVTDKQKEKLVERLKLNSKASPTQRGYLTKPGKSNNRPLSIPTVKDIAKQALCKLALEPEWEARFEVNSYGFRPDRRCQDAVEAISQSLRNHSKNRKYHKYLLDAEITKCFNRMDHDYLLQKLGTLPEIEGQVRAWLKVGILKEFSDELKQMDLLENHKCTSQGGILFPLLLNIALHGMENHMKEWICTQPSFTKPNVDSKNVKRKSLALIRYADAFVIVHKNEGIIEAAKEEITKWLWDGPRLKINEDKTSIRNINHSFDFLGFSFITITRDSISRAKIYPSRKSQERLLLKVRNIIQNNRSASSYNLINLLHPIILGWANYFKYSECLSTFSKLNHLIVQKLRAWVFRRDTRNGRKDIKQRYFPSGKSYIFDGTKHQNNWILNGNQKGKAGTYKKNWLPSLVWVKSAKWVKIKDIKSSFDADNLY